MRNSRNSRSMKGGSAAALLARLGYATEGLEMLADDRVENGVLGVMRAIHRLG